MPRGWAYGKKRKSGFRSGLEEKIAAYLQIQKIGFEYEPEIWYYNKKIPRGQCLDCQGKRVVKVAGYKPDFKLDNDVYIEVKGRLTPQDRVKLVAVREAHPNKKLVLYFQTNNKISKSSETRYSEWASKHNFDFAIGSIPRRWLSRQQSED